MISDWMPGPVDQMAKLGSMAFMCTMMANLLPCLATMDNNEFLTNITAFGVLVITLNRNTNKDMKQHQIPSRINREVLNRLEATAACEKLLDNGMKWQPPIHHSVLCDDHCFWGEKTNLDQSQYVLQLENEMELAERTLKGLSKSMNKMIQQGEKKQPNNLKKLILEKSTKYFHGVKMFDNNYHHAHYSPSREEYLEGWSLPVVTLTTIAITLPNIEKAEVESLMKSVREDLEYVTLVE
ncbi:hypothetical protein L1987_15131 [Smallanthus sonchifolius]|uniref:Uncharacterized protein n=1 Tax=Smallanthus sonchifolius TaxID=185202 RepID=A0ACB9J708_9ASTR|nr:hypothetical protein L1987_15131 [Smallanthus sonchifolius]